MKIHFERREETAKFGNMINVMPLVDMVFLLLIFFLLTFSFTSVWAVRVNLPGIHNPDRQVEARVMRVAITADGALSLDGHSMNLDELEDALRVKMTGRKDTAVLLVSADAAVMHGEVVQVMGAARAAGIKRLAIEAADLKQTES